MPTSDRVILIGASVRAAAFSALRAGLTPWCVDLFADADLCAVADARAISFADYPRAFLDALTAAPPGPVIYTGGLENHPQLIEEIAAKRSLWGNNAESLHLSRDPFHVSRILNESGLACPRLSLACAAGSDDTERAAQAREVLRKPFRSAGGANISFASNETEPTFAYYLQQFIPGPSYAASYCAYPDRTLLLGVTEQLTGEPWLNAQPFHYCGSIGPIDLRATVRDALKRLGEVLRIGCGLRGLFGIDFILHEGQPWPVEVNPRYTASIEVLELATGLQAMTHHCSAFRVHVAPSSEYSHVLQSEHGLVGKAILFAAERITFSAKVDSSYADIPYPGTIIEAGWPILTLFGKGSSPEQCRNELRKRAMEYQPTSRPLTSA